MADRLHNALIAAHQEWLGFVQPVGLVLAPTVMVEAQAIPDRNIADRQREFRDLLELRELADEEGRGPKICWRAPICAACSGIGSTGMRTTSSMQLSTARRWKKRCPNSTRCWRQAGPSPRNRTPTPVG